MSERNRTGLASTRWAAGTWLVGVALFFCAATVARAQIEAYEGDFLPELFGWQRLPSGPAQGERSVQDGWFTQTMRADEVGPSGESSFFRKPLDRFVGIHGFFIEWRATTDGPAWVIEQGQVPTVVAAAGKAESWYHTTFADSAAALFRDPRFGTLIVPVSGGSPHVYRVEVFADEYIWYIDGVVVDSGIPEGPYPDPDAALVWGARREYVDATTAWDFVRAGRIPDAGTGDYDSSGYQDTIDYYFVHDCLTKDGPGIFGGPGEPGHSAGPGCRFADFDADEDVDLRDFADFQILFSEIPCGPFCPWPFAPDAEAAGAAPSGSFARGQAVVQEKQPASSSGRNSHGSFRIHN